MVVTITSEGMSTSEIKDFATLLVAKRNFPKRSNQLYMSNERSFAKQNENLRKASEDESMRQERSTALFRAWSLPN